MNFTLHGIGLLPVFLVGLLGSVHCAGMCGGIVAALSVPLQARAFPVPVRTVNAYSWEWPAAASHVVAYNAGRLASYATAGALAGGLAGGLQRVAGLPQLQLGALYAANLMLLALGLYLLDAWRGLAWLERGGRVLWRRVSPLLTKIGPFDSPGRLFAAGALWGWLPCGMVYSVLVTAMLSGSALGGAAVMLAFGLGTLPMLAAIGMAGVRLRTVLRLSRVRAACGLLVLSFGLLGLWRATGGLPVGVLDLLCIGGAR